MKGLQKIIAVFSLFIFFAFSANAQAECSNSINTYMHSVVITPISCTNGELCLDIVVRIAGYGASEPPLELVIDFQGQTVILNQSITENYMMFSGTICLLQATTPSEFLINCFIEVNRGECIGDSEGCTVIWDDICNQANGN